jgi:hypothetical protein
MALPEVRGVRALVFRAGRGMLPIVIFNRSRSPIRLWQDGNSWGYRSVRLEYSGLGAQAGVARRREFAFKQNSPTYFTLGPSEPHVMVLELGIETWEGLVLPAAGHSSKLDLMAVYEVETDEESARHSVWSGRINAVRLPVQFEHRAS